MQRASRAKQVKIYIGKCFRVFINDKGWKIFVSAAVITAIICMVTSSDMFIDYWATRNGAFALACACIWIGIFNSIQSVCKERDIIKREHRSGLHISSYVVAHMVYEMALCAIESVIVTLIICVVNSSSLPDSGVLLPIVFEIWVTFFLIIYSSDALGLMVSSIVRTPTTAMTVMPFVLIIQLVMSGMIFKLEGVSKVISDITIAKWGLNAICITANASSLKYADPSTAADYEYSVSHITQMWMILMLFIVIYAVVSIISLEFIDKDKR